MCKSCKDASTGRVCRIQTYDLLVPNQAHYQAVLIPVNWSVWRGSNSRRPDPKSGGIPLAYRPIKPALRELVGAVGIEPTVFLMSLIYSQLPSPLGTHTHKTKNPANFRWQGFGILKLFRT